MKIVPSFVASALYHHCLRGRYLVAMTAVLLAAPTDGLAIGLIGDSVNFQCTNCAPPTNNTFVVLQGTHELSLFDQFQVDVEGESLRINWIFDSAGIIDANLIWSDLDFLDVPGEIVGVNIDPSSTWGQNAFVTFTADSVSLTNNGDRTVVVGDFWLANLEVRRIPEPGAALLSCIGLAAACFIRRRRAR